MNMGFSEKAILRALAKNRGDKTLTLNWFRKWYMIKDSPDERDLIKVLDAAPGEWNMKREKFLDTWGKPLPPGEAWKSPLDVWVELENHPESQPSH